MSKTIRREACLKCQSSNNLCTWLDDVSGKEITKCKTPDCDAGKVDTLNLSLVGEYRDIFDRKISKDTCEKMNYQVTTINDSFWHIANHIRNNKLLAQKVRVVEEKKFFFTENSDTKEIGLWNLYNDWDYEKPLIVTEGELDALSCVEVGFQACSLSRGNESVELDLIKDKKELLNYKQIILAFDNDDAGKAALKKATSILPLETLRIIVWDNFKDANEVLCYSSPFETWDGYKELQAFVETCIEYTPDGIQFGYQLDKEVFLEQDEEGLIIDFPILNKMLHGLHKGQLYLLGAGSKIGKSLLFRQMTYDLRIRYSNLKIANLFLEQRQKVAPLTYLAIHNKIPVGEFVENPLKFITKKKFDEDWELLINNDKLMFPDRSYDLDSKQLLATLKYLAEIKHYDIIVLDHISLVISGSGVSRNGERRDIDELMHNLRKLIDNTGLIVLAACHLSNPDFGKDWEDGREVKMADYRGSGSLRQIPDVLIGAERNIRHQIDKNKLLLRVLGNRWYGDTGEADILFYYEEHGTLISSDAIFRGNK